MIMELIGSGGVLIPMPQYPLYTATLTLLGMDAIPYYLVEEANWGLDVICWPMLFTPSLTQV